MPFGVLWNIGTMSIFQNAFIGKPHQNFPACVPRFYGRRDEIMELTNVDLAMLLYEVDGSTLLKTEGL